VTLWKWRLFDGTDTYVFDVNPNEGGTPTFEKNILEESTAAPDGLTLIFEGAEKPKPFNFSGVILEQSQYEAMLEWYQKRRQVRVTDDLGRQFWIYIKKFEATRGWRVSHPWRHTFSIEATVVDWPT
jgi:hypothetical protein